MQLSRRPLPVALFSTVLVVASCATEARNARERLDNPDPEIRIAAIQDVLRLALAGEVSGWQQIQDKGCRDSESRVRVAALQALGQFVEAKPNEVVKKSPLGNWEYVDVRLLKTLGTDPSTEVRMATATFWARADILWEEGIKNLKDMLENEKEKEVVSAAREGLAQRLERSVKKGNIKAEEADEIRKIYDAPELQK